LVNVSYGRAYLTRLIKVEPGRAARELFVLNAGGLRLNARTADGQSIASGAVVNEIYSDERDQAGNRQLIVAGIRPGVILRLNAGLYHVKSTYGDANGVVQGDISIEAGRLTELTLSHEAANVTLKLVTETGGEALADTQWRIYTPDGTLVRESVGALPTHILAPGRYNVEAVRNGRKYAEIFEVVGGKPRTAPSRSWCRRSRGHQGAAAAIRRSRSLRCSLIFVPIEAATTATETMPIRMVEMALISGLTPRRTSE
jgi:hypothetical protein